MTRRRLLWWALLGIGILVMVILIGPRVGRRIRHRQVEAAIARFEAHPTQQGANGLAKILDRQTATREQGQRILKAILYPKAVTRSAYPRGTRPTFSIERPFNVHVGHATVSMGYALWVDGKESWGGSSGGGNFLTTKARLYSLGAEQEEPGRYYAEVRYEYALTPMTRKTTWAWNAGHHRFPLSLLPSKAVAYSSDPHAEPVYTCRFTVPIEITVVEIGRAERIDLLDDPVLDAKMAGAFTCGQVNLGGTYLTAAGKREHTGGIEVKYTATPSAVAFKAVLRLANGNEITADDKHVGRYRVRAGTSGAFHVTAADLQVEEPGDYRAVVVLRPDPEYAYQDPAIKAVWDGTLKFPISFRVYQVSGAP